MKRLLLALLLLAPAPALAQDDRACEAAEEVLKWTAEALVEARDGKPLGQGAMYIADAVEYAADRTLEEGWPEDILGVLDELGMLASMIDERGGVVEPGEAEGLLGYADALAATTLERCGPEEIPVFVRPGVGDARACDAVIDTLDRLAQMLPSIAGEGSPLVATMLLPVTNSALRARAQAEAAQWSAPTLDALQQIADGVRGVVQAARPVGGETASAMQALGETVAAEAKQICVGATIPLAEAT